MSKGFINQRVLESIKRQLHKTIATQDVAIVNKLRSSLAKQYPKNVIIQASQEVMHELSPELGLFYTGVLMPSMPQLVQENLIDASLEMIADLLEKAGLPVWKHLRASDRGFAISKPARNVIAATNFPGIGLFPTELSDTVEHMGIHRPFMHSLGVIEETVPGVPGTNLNMNQYALVSFAINIVLFEPETGDPKKSEAFLREVIVIAAPTADFNAAMKRAAYDDRWLLKVANWAIEGFNLKAQHTNT
jgi:hypothetical protein